MKITNDTNEDIRINFYKEELEIVNTVPVLLRWLCEPSLALREKSSIISEILPASQTMDISPLAVYIKLRDKQHHIAFGPINPETSYSIIETSDNDECFRLIHDNDEDIK